MANSSRGKPSRSQVCSSGVAQLFSGALGLAGAVDGSTPASRIAPVSTASPIGSSAAAELPRIVMSTDNASKPDARSSRSGALGWQQWAIVG